MVSLYEYETKLPRAEMNIPNLLCQKGADIEIFSLCKALKFTRQSVSLVQQVEVKLYRKGANMPRLSRGNTATIYP